MTAASVSGTLATLRSSFSMARSLSGLVRRLALLGVDLLTVTRRLLRSSRRQFLERLLRFVRRKSLAQLVGELSVAIDALPVPVLDAAVGPWFRCCGSVVAVHMHAVPRDEHEQTSVPGARAASATFERPNSHQIRALGTGVCVTVQHVGALVGDTECGPNCLIGVPSHRAVGHRTGQSALPGIAFVTESAHRRCNPVTEATSTELPLGAAGADRAIWAGR